MSFSCLGSACTIAPDAHVNPPSSGSAAPPRSYRRTPLVRTRARYSEAGPSRPHAGPLFRSWALSSAREPAISYEGGLAHAPISRFGLLNTWRCRVASLDVRPAHGLVLHSLFALWPRGISFEPGRHWALELHSRALWYPPPGWFGGRGGMRSIESAHHRHE